MQVLPPVQLARSRVRGTAVREGRAPARPSRTRRAMDPRLLGRDKRDPPVPGAQWTRAALGRDKRDPPVRRIRRVTMWCRGRGRRPRRPVRPMAFPCTCRAALGRDKRDPPVPGAQWTRAASVATSATLPCPARNGPAPPSVATSATLPCAVSAGLPCGAVVGADVLGGPRVRWHLRLQAVPKVNIGRICWNACRVDATVMMRSRGGARRCAASVPNLSAPRRAEGRCKIYQNQIRLCSLPPTGTNTAFGSSTYVPRTVRSRRSSCAYLRWFRPRRAIWRRREQP